MQKYRKWNTQILTQKNPITTKCVKQRHYENQMSMEHCSNEYAPLLMSVFFLNYDRSLKAIKQFPIKPEDL